MAQIVYFKLMFIKFICVLRVSEMTLKMRFF